MPYTVFISYSWSNSAERLALTSEISNIAVVKVLADKEAILAGDSVHQRVSELIDVSDCVVVLLTPDGLESREVLDEVSRSHDRQKYIIPVVSEGIKLDNLPWYLRDVNWVQYDRRNFDSVVNTIVDTIKRRLYPLAYVDQERIPRSIKKLIDLGVRSIDLSYVGLLSQKIANDYLYCKLKLHSTGEILVFRANKIEIVSVVAGHLAGQVLPHLKDYEWSIIYRNKALPPYLSLREINIRNGDTVYLEGKYRKPRRFIGGA